MKSIDPFLDRRPGPKYNCFDFVREAWLYLTGEDVADKLQGLIGSFDGRHVTLSGVKGFKRLPEPHDYCFVVLQREKTVPHCGIYLERRMLHLTDAGVQFQPLSVAKGPFKIIRYYESEVSCNFNIEDYKKRIRSAIDKALAKEK